MADDTSGFAKGESPMTDLQFSAYVELRDKYEALLELRLAPSIKADDTVNDYQFKRYEQLRDKCDKLSGELDSLRKENATLKLQMDMLKSNAKKYRL